MTGWTEIERRRIAAGLSRAEMCRRAGVSESTVFKGLLRRTSPSNPVERQIAAVLAAAEAMKEEHAA